MNSAPVNVLRAPFFAKETLVKGRPTQLDCIEVEGCTLVFDGRHLTQASVEDEWYTDLEDPAAVVAALRRMKRPPDLFTFWQRMPDVEPRYPYAMQTEDIAVLPIRSYDHWWNQQIKSRVRNQIRKAEKDGLVVRETVYDDEFVRGMTAIFNEAPVRQGRPFWHYGKSFETVKSQFARYLHRETMIGAWYGGELVGFIMLGDAGRFAVTGQIISSLRHRDKSPNNALVAKAIEVCARKGLPFLIYLHWSDDSLAEFKRRCGFERTAVPRYWVPITWKGRLALALGLHQGWKALLPAPLKSTLKRWRRRWYERGGTADA